MTEAVKDKAVSQMTSGRWLLTVTAGACLMVTTLTCCWQGVHGEKPFIDPAALTGILTMVFVSYFNKANGNNADGQ